MPARTLIVVPCYDEERRLDRGGFAALLARPRTTLLFIDDGSRDGTRALLERWAAETPGLAVLALPENRGKAEAVRTGLREALARGAEITGFLDADLATPAAEMARLCDLAEAGGDDAVLGSRVALAGRVIERTPVRHYLGRVFATCASLVLRAPVYDTQCGAKVFRAGAPLDAALAEPFGSRWSFDVELLGRLLVAGGTLREAPLEAWRDMSGSKLRLPAAIKATVELVRIDADLRRRRRGSRS
jgi:glycosyltransferase involved in cell wall biosynthesis